MLASLIVVATQKVPHHHRRKQVGTRDVTVTFRRVPTPGAWTCRIRPMTMIYVVTMQIHTSLKWIKVKLIHARETTF